MKNLFLEYIKYFPDTSGGGNDINCKLYVYLYFEVVLTNIPDLHYIGINHKFIVNGEERNLIILK